MSIYTFSNQTGPLLLSQLDANFSVGGAYTPAGTGAVATTVQDALLKRGRYASDFAGYDATGATDSLGAIQAAINAANADGTNTVYITGKPQISAPLTYSTMLALVGVGGGEIFTNSFDNYPVRINCYGVTGYTFTQPAVVDGSGALALSNICFDGRNPSGGAFSTTWQGLVNDASTSGALSSFYLRLKNILVGGSNSATPILGLVGQVTPYFNNVMFISFPYGMAASFKYSGGTTIPATSVTFDKCQFDNLRQCVEAYGGITDVTFNDCVFESCVTGVASFNNNVVFNNCYLENMGFDATGTGITTGITPRAFGIVDAPVIAGNVKAIFTCRYGQMIFNSCTLAATTGGLYYFDGIGRSSGTNPVSGGRIELNDIFWSAGTLTPVFQPDVDTPSSRGNFEYGATQNITQVGYLFTYANARMLTYGRVAVNFNDGVTRPVEVNNGLYTVRPGLVASGGFTTPPTVYPDNGWLVGDIAYRSVAGLQACATRSWICTTAGTSGVKWDTNEFVGASARNTALANAGTLQVPVLLEEQGDIHVYEVMTSGNGTTNYSAINFRINHLSGGSGSINVQGNANVGVTCSYTHGNSYFTITNGSGITLEVYARLVSRGRTHA